MTGDQSDGRYEDIWKHEVKDCPCFFGYGAHTCQVIAERVCPKKFWEILNCRRSMETTWNLPDSDNCHFWHMEVIPTLRLKLAEGRSGSSRHWAGVSWFLVFTSCTALCAVYCSKCLETICTLFNCDLWFASCSICAVGVFWTFSSAFGHQLVRIPEWFQSIKSGCFSTSRRSSGSGVFWTAHVDRYFCMLRSGSNVEKTSPVQRSWLLSEAGAISFLYYCHWHSCQGPILYGGTLLQPSIQPYIPLTTLIDLFVLHPGMLWSLVSTLSIFVTMAGFSFDNVFCKACVPWLVFIPCIQFQFLTLLTEVTFLLVTSGNRHSDMKRFL